MEFLRMEIHVSNWELRRSSTLNSLSSRSGTCLKVVVKLPCWDCKPSPFNFNTYTMMVNEIDISQNIFVKGFVKAVLWNSHCQSLAERAHTEETTKQFLSDFSVFRECHYIFRLRKDRECSFPREEYNCFMKKKKKVQWNAPIKKSTFPYSSRQQKIQLSPKLHHPLGALGYLVRLSLC